MEDEGIKYVVRLKMGNHPKVVDAEGKELWLGVKREEKRFWKGVRCLGKVRGNVAAYFGKEFREPIYVFSNLEPEEALALYRQRMKIEETFRDAKGLMGLERVMSKSRKNLEASLGLMLLAYAVGVMLGEVVRDEVCRSKKSESYSGLFILLRHRLRLMQAKFRRILRIAQKRFWAMVKGYVPYPT